jgi:hypothetical protein
VDAIGELRIGRGFVHPGAREGWQAGGRVDPSCMRSTIRRGRESSPVFFAFMPQTSLSRAPRTLTDSALPSRHSGTAHERRGLRAQP